MTLCRLRGAALVATVLFVPACLQVPPEPPEPGDVSRPPDVAAAPDAANLDDRLDCDAQFGGADGYQLCSATESTCSFLTDEGEGDKFDCDERCAAFGSTCVTGFDADGHSCGAQTEDGCAFPHETQICVCLRS
ncbi:MAG TPA: hypothetical protein VFU21_24600 [Kofleriaceae bacterium]|nr:hypothetical protein [Kofleriaceae bacterium]